MEASYAERLEDQLEQTRQKLAKLAELGARQISRTDPDGRFLHQADDFVLGYTRSFAALKKFHVRTHPTRIRSPLPSVVTQTPRGGTGVRFLAILRTTAQIG